MDNSFVNIFGLGLGLGFNSFWSRNLPVSISVLVSEKLSVLGLGLDYFTGRNGVLKMSF